MLDRAWALLRHGMWALVAGLVVACGGGSTADEGGASGSGPSVVAIQFVAGAPDRLEVTFSEPMTPTYYTTGAYVPTSSVWESTTRFVITFSGVTPGGVIVLKAPTASDTRGFRSAGGAAMPTDLAFRFPGGSAPTIVGYNFVDATPARLEVNFSTPMDPGYFTTGAYVPASSVWETSTKFVVTFTSFTRGGTLTLKAPASGDPRGFKSASGVGMLEDVPFRFPVLATSAGGPVVTALSYVATAPSRLEVTFSEPMGPGFFTTGSYAPTSSVWETSTKFVITFSSVTPGGQITLKGPSGGSSGFRSAAGAGLATDVPFRFPTDPPVGSSAPRITGLSYSATAPARLEVNFGEPMSAGYFTTGTYVPTSSVWETTTRFAITFASVTPGGVITLSAGGFSSAAGTAMAADLPFQFPPTN